ncbi:helix-turn-helix transcriptional regulator [Eisenbergiella sp.]
MNSYRYSPEKLIETEHFTYPQDYEMPRFHCHNAYELCLPVSGEYTLVTMEEAFCIGSACAAFTPPGCMHKSFVSSGSELLILYFSERFLSRFFTGESRQILMKDFQTTHFKIKESVLSGVHSLFLRLEAAVEKNDYNRIYPLFVGLLTLLSTDFRAAPVSFREKKGPEALTAGVLSYIGQNYASIASLEEVASHFFITKYHLCRIFKAATGSTVLEHLNSIRLLHACSLLQNSQESITEISLNCGFHSSAYFTKLFKETLGVTPRVFRRTSKAESTDI